MDIRNILKENAFGAPIAYRHMDALHVGVLRKIAKGQFDPSIASEKVQDIVNELISFGLVSDMDYTITPEGEKALQYVDKLGGSVDRRQALAAKDKTPSRDDQYFEID